MHYRGIYRGLGVYELSDLTFPKMSDSDSASWTSSSEDHHRAQYFHLTDDDLFVDIPRFLGWVDYPALCNENPMCSSFGYEPLEILLRDITNTWDFSEISDLSMGNTDEPAERSDSIELHLTMTRFIFTRLNNLTSMELINHTIDWYSQLADCILRNSSTLTAVTIAKCNFLSRVGESVFHCLRFATSLWMLELDLENPYYPVVGFVVETVERNLGLKYFTFILRSHIDLRDWVRLQQAIHTTLSKNKFFISLELVLHGNPPTLDVSQIMQGLLLNTTLEFISISYNEQYVNIVAEGGNAVATSTSLKRINCLPSPNLVMSNRRDIIATEVFYVSRLIVLFPLPIELVELVLAESLGDWFPRDDLLILTTLHIRELMGELHLYKFSAKFSASTLIRVCENLRLDVLAPQELQELSWDGL